MKVRKAEITGGCHAFHLMAGRFMAWQLLTGRARHSQPRAWATRMASARLRAPVFWMQDER